MAQIKIYGHRRTIDEKRDRISDAVHKCMVEVIKLPKDKRFHRFFPMDAINFIHPEDRSVNYLILEISMFEGRDSETKKRLIKTLIRTLSNAVDISSQDIEITLFETSKTNWGIRGLPGDELTLGYKVEV